MNDLSLFTITLTLFLIMDPVGHIAAYLKMMEGISSQRRNVVLLREMGIALGAMLLFNLLGESIFSYLELSESTVRLVAGVILFITAIKILFPSSVGIRGSFPPGEPFIIPLAIPYIAGPSLLATILLYSNMESQEFPMLMGIVLAWIATSVVLWLAPVFNKVLGKNGLGACERLLAMVLVMISIQRFMEGIQQFIQARG